MQLSGSLDMQFCFSVLFFVLLTAWLTSVVCRRWLMAGRWSAESGDGYAAELERLKQAEKEG